MLRQRRFDDFPTKQRDKDPDKPSHITERQKNDIAGPSLHVKRMEEGTEIKDIAKVWHEKPVAIDGVHSIGPGKA